MNGMGVGRMDGISRLIDLAGRWTGTYRLWFPDNDGMREFLCVSGATITPTVRDTFVRLDYTWSHEGTPHEGCVLVGYEVKDATATAVWADSWHMGAAFLVSRGGVENGAIVVRGTYAVPDSPDWGWKTVLTPDRELRLTMYNIHPGGEEMLAVDATYTRVA